MKPMFPILALAMLLPAGAAMADDDCHAPTATWQPREAALAMAATSGWTVREFKIDDGCYEFEGRDKDGHPFEAKLDPATLQIVEMEWRMGKGTPGAAAPPAVVNQ